MSDKVEWRHTLHVGQFDIGDAYERVEAAFPDAEQAPEARRAIRAPAPLLALAVTPDGRPIMDSLQVSSAAWSIAQTLRIGIDDSAWLHGFDDALSDVRGAFERIVLDSAGGPATGGAADSKSGATDASDGARELDESGGTVQADDGIATSPDAEESPGAGAGLGTGAEPAAVDLFGNPLEPADGPVPPRAPAAINLPSAVAPTTSDDDSNIIEAIDDEGVAVEPITWDQLLRLLGAASKILELDGQLVIRPVVRTTTWAESRVVPYGSGDTLLNSFAVDDLERVAHHVHDHAPGSALARYLDAAHVGETEAAERIEVDDDLASVRTQVEPRRIPAGRWPADPAQDLALGQQLAVNLAVGRGDGGQSDGMVTDGPNATERAGALSIVAVNGPPGTGKTTMLRDLIAAVVTERAAVIAAFDHPGELFKGEALSVQGDRAVRVHKLAPGVAGHELLLACATNAAAQNVSLELPDARAVHAEWRDGSGSLADFATAALRAGAASDARAESIGPNGRPAQPAGPTLDGFESFAPGRGGPVWPGTNAPGPGPGGADENTDPLAANAWAFIAARLGRRSYCKDFASAVWWGTAPRPGDRSGARRNAPPLAPTERAEAGLASLLARSQNSDGRAAWHASRDRFRAAHARVEAIRAEREAIADALLPSTDLEQQIAESESALADCLDLVDRADAKRTELADLAAPRVVAHEEAKRKLAEVGNATAPGHIAKRLSKDAKEQDAARKEAIQNAVSAHGMAKRALERVAVATREVESARAALEEAQATLTAARARLAARAEAAVVAAESIADPSQVPFVIPGDAWLGKADGDSSADNAGPDAAAARAARDLRAPWSDETWNRARTECFLAALDLHQTTLLANGRDAARNLRVAIDLISGRISGLTHDVVLAAWQTLFLLVPVISTTFASLPTMLAGIGREDFGWLLVDEAGQAQPQQAAGAIWRCKRAVIVGDPLQLEPVSQLPTTLAAAIRKRYEVGREYVSPEASVQRLADAVTPWGGHRGDDHLWVGVPMNVHRRCEDPIFDLVNAIAYDGRMINATVPREPHPALRVDTCWLDVPSTGASTGSTDGHWNPDEGVRLDALLEHLGRAGYDFRQVFAVSPFREVAWQLRRRADDPRHRGMTGGTIHTIQGREADTVILVLGSSPGQNAARRWASLSPNLLNVATSRARQRLYVIGDHEAWIHLPYFRELAGLRRVAPPRARTYA